ncbi:MAG: YceI family protein, partial [Melioribacteraceae bacterium]|nr:YceI family protein [Melioribacteraceae bacterium]
STQVAMLSESSVQMPDATEEAIRVVPNTSGRALFRINQDESEARFLIEEVLMGNPTTVVGATRQVAGDIIIDYANPSASTVGQIGVNVRTLKTDNDFRDQSIRGQILESTKTEYEFVTFEPTEVIGLSAEPIEVGSTVEFQVRGNLKIREVTREVIFDLTVTAVSETQIEGLARATVRYADFDISIKAPPSVSNIGEEVTLELDFVALRVEEGQGE